MSQRLKLRTIMQVILSRRLFPWLGLVGDGHFRVLIFRGVEKKPKGGTIHLCVTQ